MMTKHLRLLMLLALMLLGLVPGARATVVPYTGSDGNTLYYYVISYYDFASLVYPNYPSYYTTNYWNGYEKPTGDVVIPDTIYYNGRAYPVSAISSYAFYGCTDVTSVTLGSAVTSVDPSAFAGCSSFQNFYISSAGNSYYFTRDGMLYQSNSYWPLPPLCVCPSGRSGTVVVPDSTGFFYYDCFTYCEGLRNIELGPNTTSIYSTLYLPDQVETITINATTPPFCSYYMPIQGSPSLRILVPCNSVLAYRSQPEWQDLSDMIFSSDPTCCIPPAGISVTDITSHSFNVSWVAETGHTYAIAWSTDPELSPSQYANVRTVSSGSASFTDMQPFTTYYISMRDGCTPAQWSAPMAVHTLPLQLGRVYVKPEATGSGDGSSWHNATDDLEWAALLANAIARTYGDPVQVWVAEGRYTGRTTDSYAFHLPCGAQVYGGFVGNEPADYDLSLRDLDLHRTILDGQGVRQVLNTQNEYYSIYADSVILIDGFYLLHGASSGSYVAAYLYNSVMQNCVVDSCTSSYYYNVPMVSANYSTIRNSKILNAPSTGVETYNSQMINSLVANSASIGVYSSSYYAGNKFFNCDIVNTLADIDSYKSISGVGADTIVNCILWRGSVDNLGVFINCATTQPVNGTGNILIATGNDGSSATTLFPRFLAPESGVFVPTEASPLVDRADTSFLSRLGATDLQGHARRYGQGLDIGCYEWDGTHYCLAPIHLAVNGVTGNSAFVQWENATADSPESYELQYRQPDGAWLSVQVSSTGYMLTGLNSETSYQVRVRALCGGNMYSSFSGIVTFTTPCLQLVDVSVQVGSGDFSLYYTPMADYYNSYTQMLYTPSELGVSAPTQISSISFQHRGGTADNRQVHVYMGTTYQSTFDGTVIDTSMLTCVFGGSLSIAQSSDTGWATIPLQQPYAYQPNANLVVAILDNTDGHMLRHEFIGTYSDQAMSQYHTSYYATSVDQYTELTPTNERPNTRFVLQYCDNNPSFCVTPNVGVCDLTTTTARIVWDQAYEIQWKNINDQAWSAPIPAASSSSYQLSGLTMGNTYQVRARNICNGLLGQWRVVEFATSVMCVDRLYVKADIETPGDGLSWQTAIKRLESAMELASLIATTYGVHPQVWVAQGTYTSEGRLDYTFAMPKGISVYGGLVGNEPPDYDLSLRDWRAHPSIMDGRGQKRVLVQTSPSAAAQYTLIDGFFIQNGYAVNGSGVGVYMLDNSKLSNCVVRNNVLYSTDYTPSYGTGVYASQDDYSLKDSLLLYNVEIHNNVSYVSDYYNNDYAGGLFLSYGRADRLYIHHNHAQDCGGALLQSYSQLSNSVISSNTAYSIGGCNSYGTMVNCVVANNSSESEYDKAGMDYASVLVNDIVWGNHIGDEPSNLGSAHTVRNSAVGEDELDCVYSYNNILLSHLNDGDDPTAFYPRFLDPTHEDFRLHVASDCINRGDSAYAVGSSDLAGAARINGSDVDMGAFETHEQNHCLSPLHVHLLSINHDSAVVEWSGSGQETSWTVMVRVEDEDINISAQVATPHFCISPLVLNRDYQVKVRANCGNDDYSVNSIPLYFHSACDSSSLAPLSPFTTFSPVDNTIVYNKTLGFSWGAIPEATSYDFYFWVADAPMPDQPTLRRLSVNAAQIVLSDLFDYGRSYHWKVVAWNECLSLESGVFTVSMPQLPDLHVTQITHSDPVAGHTMTVEYTVRNDGQGATWPDMQWMDYIWLSNTSEVASGWWSNSTEYQIYSDYNLQQLNPGQQYTHTVQVMVPDLADGPYYLFVMADQNSAIGIDFTPTGSPNAPDVYTPSTDGSTYHYLSSTNAYHLNSQIDEVNEQDNFFFTRINILPPPTPDLQVTHITHPMNVFSNSDIQISWTVTNMGNEAILSGNSWVDRVYLFTDQMQEQAEVTEVVPVSQHLNIDGSYTLDAIVHIPLDMFGDIHVAVKTDCDNNINERHFELNNVMVSDQIINVVMAPVPDLVVSSAVVPATATSGERMQINYMVSNIGTSDVLTSADWFDYVFISDSPVFSEAHSTRLAARYHSISDGLPYEGSCLVDIPANQRNDFYIHIVVDYHNDVFEHLGDSNNCTTYLVHLVHPDFTVRMVEAPTTLNYGATNRISWMIKNEGSGSVSNLPVVSHVYANEHRIYTSNIRRTMMAGDSMLVSADIRVPCSATNHVDYYVMVNDYRANNAIFEGADTSNNRTAVVSAVMQSADFGVEIINAPDTAWSGSQVCVTYRVTNYNSALIPCRFRVNFYCSDNVVSIDPNRIVGSELISTSGFTGAMEDAQATLTLPHGIEGGYYIHAVVNAGDSVCEGANSHANIAHSPLLMVHLSPSPDLVPQIADLSLDTLVVGQSVSLRYRVKNQGTAHLVDQTVQMKGYLSLNAGINNSSVVAFEQSSVISIPAGDSITQFVTFIVPAVPTSGNYYFILQADALDEVYEHNGENNNSIITDPFYVYRYPYDFRIDSVKGPAEAHWGDQLSYTLYVSDTSSFVPLDVMLVEGVYFSSDSVIDSRDHSFTRSIMMDERTSHHHFTTQVNVTVPYGPLGNYHVIAKHDVMRRHPDMNTDNNVMVLPINILPVPTPDLAISDVQLLENLSSGQYSRLTYKVTNIDTLPICGKSWSDRAFVVLGVHQDSLLQVGSSNHHPDTMLTGQYYIDTMDLCVPLPYCGTLTMMVRANASNGFFEAVTSNNDTSFAVNVELPMPGDLVVTTMSHPDTIHSGNLTHVEWVVKNQGSYGIRGNNLKSLIYVSADNSFDVNDKLLGTVTTNNVVLLAGGELTQQLDVRVTSLPEGSYYFIVKTDVYNAFYETNDDNNASASADPFRLVVRRLPFDTPVADTYQNDVPADYVLDVGNNLHETVRLYLKSDDSLQTPYNHLYVSYNTMGDNLNFTYSSSPVGEPNPELFIPATQEGYYGVSVFAENRGDSIQRGVIEADILPFEIRSINPNHGGNTGKVTVELKGSRFNPNMRVWMAMGHDTVYASHLDFVNYFQSFAEFDLTGRTPGLYDVGILHHCEGEIVVSNAFTVEEGLPEALNTYLYNPTSTRPNREVMMILYFTNQGNTDIRNAVIQLRSETGNPVSTTSSGLSENKTTLSLPLSIEGEPDGLLRPGVTGQIIIYSFSSNNLVYTINRIR